MKANIVSQSNGKTRQFITAIIVNLLSMAYGVCCGWTSPIVPQLRSSHPPIGDAPMSNEQISWITSLLPIGGLLTIPFCGVLSERIGRKNFALLTALPLVISWLLIIFGRSHMHLFAARLFVGIAGAMTIYVVPLFVSEIVSEDIRGFLGSLLIFTLNVGILFAYIAGAVLSYRLFAIVSLTIPLAFLAAFSLIPESPVYLVRRNLLIQARKSLMFFQGDNEALVEEELTKLRSLAKSSDSSSNKIKLSDLIKNKATRKGLFLSFGLLAGQQLSGIFAMMSYAETIFKHAGSSLSAETASIIIAAIQIVGSSASTMLVERAGRRPLILISCFGMAISHAFVSLFFFLQNNNYDVSSISWLPLVALSTYIITYCLGMGPVPFVIISEVFSLDVSSFASNVCFVFFFIVGFTAIKSFDLSMKFLGDGGCFCMLATFCAASFAFCFWFLPETKGRKREDIVDELAGIDDNSCREKIDVVNKNAETEGFISTKPV